MSLTSTHVEIFEEVKPMTSVHNIILALLAQHKLSLFIISGIVVEFKQLDHRPYSGDRHETKTILKSMVPEGILEFSSMCSVIVKLRAT